MTKGQHSASRKGEVLVAILNNLLDFRILEEHLWYRIPIQSAPRRWPPQWIAFYQAKKFGEEGMSVRYYGRVREIRKAPRYVLFPNEMANEKSERWYYQVFLEELEELETPILSRKPRRVTFISTTWQKLKSAGELNDLFDDSPLEDALWQELKRLGVQADRQFDVSAGDSKFKLDFAVFCAQGKVNIETDGDTWHADPARIPEDNKRNNALTSKGWQVLRFNGAQIRESMAEYCVPQILETMNRLGGLAGEDAAPRVYHPTDDGIVQQLGLFGGEESAGAKPFSYKKGRKRSV